MYFVVICSMLTMVYLRYSDVQSASSVRSFSHLLLQSQGSLLICSLLLLL